MRDLHSFARFAARVLGVGFLAGCVSGETGGKYALVIGNSAYPGNEVSGVKDAICMAGALNQLGFRHVKADTNVSYSKMTSAIDKFGEKIKQAEVVVFFFSGHGYQLKGEDYLYTVDEGSIQLQYVLNHLAIAEKAVKIVILDACRGNEGLSIDRTHLRDMKGWKPGFAEVPVRDAPKIALLFAAQPGETAASGLPDALSPYSESVLRFISQPGLELCQLLRNVYRDTYRRTRGKQLPWDANTGSIPMPFYMRPTR